MNGKLWTVDDIQYLAASYHKEDREIMCHALGRSWDSIQLRAHMLGLKREPRGQVLVNGMKQCSRCRVWALPSAFPVNDKTKTGFDSWCKGCKKLSWRLYKYNLTEEEYNKLVESGVCAICGGNVTDGNHEMPIDHDHKTNRVRGLLCTLCNKGLGSFKDSPALLRAAAEYLEQQEKFLG